MRSRSVRFDGRIAADREIVSDGSLHRFRAASVRATSRFRARADLARGAETARVAAEKCASLSSASLHWQTSKALTHREPSLLIHHSSRVDFGEIEAADDDRRAVQKKYRANTNAVHLRAFAAEIRKLRAHG